MASKAKAARPLKLNKQILPCAGCEMAGLAFDPLIDQENSWVDVQSDRHGAVSLAGDHRDPKGMACVRPKPWSEGV
jgi:hypothetical protein